VLADAPLIPELLQQDCTPEKLAAACLRWLGQPDMVDALLPRFVEIHTQLRRDASARASDAVLELIASKSTDPSPAIIAP
jgi:lipid-A-disaccharide synthase